MNNCQKLKYSVINRTRSALDCTYSQLPPLENTCFFVDLGGTPPPNYKWQFEGSPDEEALAYQCRTNVTSATMLAQLMT